jgi:tetratricopeptide (TPR) repeat protein
MAEGDWDVFVSYGHADAAWVHVLAGNLHRAGFEVFLDVWELAGGDRLTGRLEEGIRRSANGVLVVSPHTLSRPWVAEEYAALVRQAVEQPGRRLIPVLLTDAELPPFLANRVWVDFRGPAATGPEYEARLEELVRALQGRPAVDRPARSSAQQWPPAPGGQRFRMAGPLRATLRIAADEVTLTDGQEPVSHRPQGLGQATVSLAAELAWRRTHPRPGAAPGEEDAALAVMGRLLSFDFLAGPAGEALAGRVAEVESLNEVLELGLEIAGPDLADLPWETLVCPQPSGEVAQTGGSPLVLHRNVALYRQLDDPGVAPAHKVRGPLRLLVAIASPETGGGELLDYEAELARIVAAVERARRRGRAYVRMLREGSLAAIATALSEDPEGFHVLHLSCHARPGELILETPDGQADLVTAGRLLEEGVPAGADLPMIVLSGCSTGLAARRRQPSAGAAGLSFKDDGEGEAVLASFAAELVRAGVPQVLAMQAPVTDSYATQLTAEMYRHLASDATPDPLLALAYARRSAERDRLALPPGSPRRGPAEWATPALLARGLRLPLFNRHEPFAEVRPPRDPVLAEGVMVREVGEFVGRRGEARKARRTLAGPKAGLVIHGIGGVGKSTLAAEVLRSLGEDAGLVVSRTGPLLVDDLLGETGARLHQMAGQSGADDPLAQDGLALRAADVEWGDRWRRLAEQVLPVLPMTVLLDNFEDNLHPGEDGGWAVRDPELADLLTRWVTRPGRSRLLITSRYPFTLPGPAARRLDLLPLGPLSPAETRKLIWRLPGLDVLNPPEKERAYRDVGGHPRALEYLDALLRHGQARFDDIAARMEDQLRARDIPDPAAWLAASGGDLDASLVETITLAASDTLLPALLQQVSSTPFAQELVIGAAVYRVPVDETALIFQIGYPAQRSADPERQERLHPAEEAIDKVRGRASEAEMFPADTGEYTQTEADLAEELRPPYDPPAGLQTAIRTAQASGLLASVPRDGEAQFYAVHRWTAAAIGTLHPDATADAHRRAAAFWRWRLDVVPQSREEHIEQLLEARYHHYAAEQVVEAVAVTQAAVRELRTWGQYGRAAELCRDTLTWLPPGSEKAAAFSHYLGILVKLRGDHPTAETLYRQALDINERIGNQIEMAECYSQLSMLAHLRDDYPAAETLCRLALDISERIGDQTAMAGNYRQLGMLAVLRGDYTAAEALYREALDISERIGAQVGMARGYHQLGMLAQFRGDSVAAETLYWQALDINERLSDQAGMAASYSELGALAQDRTDYAAAETLYRQALAIYERLGNQTRVASSYRQLGRLAELSGDYPAADTFYRQALAISERLGDQVGMADSYSALGSLNEALGHAGEAVASRVVALAIHLQTDTSVGEDIRALSELRRQLGPERFRASLLTNLDAESAMKLTQMLDQWDASASD